MRPGTEETAITRINIPIGKGVRPLMGLSAEQIAQNGVKVEFDLSDGKSNGELFVDPSSNEVKDFRAKGLAGVPYVALSFALKAKMPYLITISKTNGETYASAGKQVGKGQWEYKSWKRVGENTEANIDNKVPPFSSLEVQAAEITFHQPSQRVIGARGWQ